MMSSHQVPDILEWLLQQKRISRASHPLIYAWRCENEGLLHTRESIYSVVRSFVMTVFAYPPITSGSDDGGEPGAGARLSGFLQAMVQNPSLLP
jgi:hypothetical protein